jgi:hypothetical protein
MVEEKKSENEIALSRSICQPLGIQMVHRVGQMSP